MRRAGSGFSHNEPCKDWGAIVTTVNEIINKRTGVGAGIGALVGFMLGGPVGAGIGALLGGGLANASPKKPSGEMTPKRKVVYENAMATIKDAKELRDLADVFEKEGLHGQAEMLRKRAGLRELPEATKVARRDAYRRALTSDIPEGIDEVAAAFEEQGAIDAAASLRTHASAVRAAHAAGKSAKPVDPNVLNAFADKLAKAIMHYGPTSNEAKAAASNFINARGATPDDASVADAISIAQAELEVDANAGAGTAPPAAGAVPAGAPPAAGAATSGAPPMEEDESVVPPVAGAAAPPPAAPRAVAVPAEAENPPEPVQPPPAAPATAAASVQSALADQNAVNEEAAQT